MTCGRVVGNWPLSIICSAFWAASFGSRLAIRPSKTCSRLSSELICGRGPRPSAVTGERLPEAWWRRAVDKQALHRDEPRSARAPAASDTRACFAAESDRCSRPPAQPESVDYCLYSWPQLALLPRCLLRL